MATRKGEQYQYGLLVSGGRPPMYVRFVSAGTLVVRSGLPSLVRHGNRTSDRLWG
jgi:hypothetical protein